MNEKNVVDDLLVRGLDDWVQAAEIASILRIHKVPSSVIRETSIRLIRLALEHGYMEVGSVTECDGFSPWNVALESAMNRVRDAWPKRRGGPQLGEVCWLNLTDKGRRLALEIGSSSRCDFEAGNGR